MDINLLKPILENKLKELGYELYDLNYSFKKGNNILSIVVDRVPPINMDDIVELTNELNPFIDSISLFDNEKSFMLDISSLGAEKPLKIENINEYVNAYVHVNLINPVNGENIYEGYLDEVNDDNIVISFRIKTREKKVALLKSNISKIRLAIKF